MKARITAVVAATVLSAIVTPSFAGDAAAASAKKMFLLKDGGTLYVFEDGKTALEDKFGRAINLKEGQSLETVRLVRRPRDAPIFLLPSREKVPRRGG